MCEIEGVIPVFVGLIQGFMAGQVLFGSLGVKSSWYTLLKPSITIEVCLHLFNNFQDGRLYEVVFFPIEVSLFFNLGP